jgi:hypothetical protein
VWEEGTLVDARLQAFLLGQGVEKVRVYPRPRAGILLVGDELTDLTTPAGEGQQQDLNGFWLGEALADQGLDVVALGVCADAPAEIRRVLLNCRKRQLGLLVTAGGVGEGLEDRLGEALRGLDCHVFFEKLCLEGAPSLLFARVAGMDVLGLSGEPLAAAATYDLFAGPFLLARLGAAPLYWDWRLLRHPAVFAGEAGDRADNAAPPWRLWAARPVPVPYSLEQAGGAGYAVSCWRPESPFSPLAAGATGWALEEAEGGEEQNQGEGQGQAETRRTAVFYQPAALTGPGGESRRGAGPGPLGR